jgi:Cytochrome c
MFVRAIREGKHMGTSRTVLPPMPWPWYKNLNDEDLKAIYAYLQTIPPIVNHVPDPEIAGAAGGQ